MKPDEEIGREIARTCIGEPVHWTDEFAASIGAAARKAVGEPPRMQIQGMSVEEIRQSFVYTWKSDDESNRMHDSYDEHVARIVHYLANTPAEPEADPDALVKEVWVKWETARLSRLHAGEPPDPIPFEQAYPWEQAACRAIAKWMEEKK